MPDIKISGLPAASSVAADDLFEVSQGSGALTSRKASGTQVQSFVLSSYAGATSITTLGTVATGTWQAAAISVSYGGTGATSASGARAALLPAYTGNGGKMLAVNAGGTDTEWVAAANVGRSIAMSIVFGA